MRILSAVLAAVGGIVLSWSSGAQATFHIVVIDQVFLGFEEAPAAQFVMLRTEEDLQTFVHKQVVSAFDASGGALTQFAAFCADTPACDLPEVSPACAQGGCPTATERNNDSRILIATAWAQDLFCVTPDLLATGTLPQPSGRVCYGDTGRFFSDSCFAAGAVDCVAYGSFSGDNGIFGAPVASPMPGQALVGDPARQAQCNLKTDRTAVCVGGDKANMTCTGLATECPGGACVACPGGSCRNLLASSAGFSSGPPAPENFHGDVGVLDGLAGDPEGSGAIDPSDVGAEADVLFEADRRCALPAVRRGADANLDTRVSAADVIATIQIVTAAG